MTKANPFKRNIVLCSVLLLLVIALTAAAVAMGFFWSGEPDDVPAIVPALVIEPSWLDFCGVGEGDEETHEGIVYLENQTDQKINLLFIESSCRCSAAEFPGDTLLPGEKLPMKCTLSTSGAMPDQTGTRRAGGEIWIAYRLIGVEDTDTQNRPSGSAKSGEVKSDRSKGSPSPMYARVVLTATIDSSDAALPQ